MMNLPKGSRDACTKAPNSCKFMAIYGYSCSKAKILRR